MLFEIQITERRCGMTWRKTLFRLLWKCGSDDEWFLYRLYISLRDYLAEKEEREGIEKS